MRPKTRESTVAESVIGHNKGALEWGDVKKIAAELMDSRDRLEAAEQSRKFWFRMTLGSGLLLGLIFGCTLLGTIWGYNITRETKVQSKPHTRFARVFLSPRRRHASR